MRREQKAAFVEYVGATQRSWLTRAYRLTLDHDEAKDLSQHCWAQLYLHWPKVSGRGDPNAWMATTMHNRFLDTRRSSRYRREFSRSELPETPVADRFVDEHAEEDSLRAAWAILTPQERSVVDLHVLDWRTLPEVAAMLGTSLSTVNRRWHEAKRKLRKHYKAEDDEND